jgi:hypothetical protein
MGSATSESHGSTRRSLQKLAQRAQVRSLASAREETMPARVAVCAALRSRMKAFRASGELYARIRSVGR